VSEAARICCLLSRLRSNSVRTWTGLGYSGAGSTLTACGSGSLDPRRQDRVATRLVQEGSAGWVTSGAVATVTPTQLRFEAVTAAVTCANAGNRQPPGNPRQRVREIELRFVEQINAAKRLLLPTSRARHRAGAECLTLIGETRPARPLRQLSPTPGGESVAVRDGLGRQLSLARAWAHGFYRYHAQSVPFPNHGLGTLEIRRNSLRVFGRVDPPCRRELTGATTFFGCNPAIAEIVTAVSVDGQVAVCPVYLDSWRVVLSPNRSFIFFNRLPWILRRGRARTLAPSHHESGFDHTDTEPGSR